ncbi:MAG: hypothetical protein MRY78_14420 [Saprospiraceae bacterium]|nr:hypothetical protein [Saprospiraceae bacterium]
MKLFGSYIILLAMLWQVGFLSTYMIFLEFNRDYLAQNYCININDDASMCYGSCFIDNANQQAFEQDGNTDTAVPVSDIELSTTSLFFLDHFLTDFPLIRSANSLNSRYLDLNNQLSISNIFHPPQA